MQARKLARKLGTQENWVINYKLSLYLFIYFYHYTASICSFRTFGTTGKRAWLNRKHPHQPDISLLLQWI